MLRNTVKLMVNVDVDVRDNILLRDGRLLDEDPGARAPGAGEAFLAAMITNDSPVKDPRSLGRGFASRTPFLLPGSLSVKLVVYLVAGLGIV